MLWDGATGQPVIWLPDRGRRELDEVCARISPDQLLAMEDQINQWADQTGDERTDFFASNWKAAGDWAEVANGVFLPMFEACDQQFERSGRS